MSPEGEPHRFSLKEGLFRYKSNSLHNPVTPAAFNNAAGEGSSELMTDGQEGPQGGKQGAKQGSKGTRGSLNSKTLTLLLALMLTTWACGTQTTDPQLQLIVNELRDKMPKPMTRPHSSRQATVPPSPIPHGVRGHMPHDPNCDACQMVRLTAPPATRNPLDSEIEDSDKGFVLGIDLYGPFTPDVDGNVYAVVGVEVGHTNYGMVRLMPDKTAVECTEAVASMRSELRTMSKDLAKGLVRVHSDDDPYFKKELRAYLVAEGIRQTHTGGYRPTKTVALRDESG